MYITSEVDEIDLSSISKESINLFERYRSFYLEFFDHYRRNFVQSKFIGNIERLGSEVSIVSATIKTIRGDLTIFVCMIMYYFLVHVGIYIRLEYENTCQYNLVLMYTPELTH